jgi:2-oxoglutarate dehydrogenase complex dehydrogenase (E1) component-like enzyme
MRLSRAQYERRIGFETNVTTCFRRRWLQSRLEKLAADATANIRKAGR